MPVTQINAGPPPKKTVQPVKKIEPIPDTSQIQKDREEGANGIFQICTGFAIAFGQWADAGAFRLHGPTIAKESAELANKYDRLGNALDVLTQVGPFAAIGMAVTSLVVQLGANHGKIPVPVATSFGAVSPDILAEKMRIKAEQETMEMRVAMAREEQELAEMRKNHETMMSDLKEPVPA